MIVAPGLNSRDCWLKIEIARGGKEEEESVGMNSWFYSMKPKCLGVSKIHSWDTTKSLSSVWPPALNRVEQT